METKERAVGIIGLGDMGKVIASNLMETGWQAVLYNRTREKAVYFKESLPHELQERARVAANMDDLFGLLRRRPGDNAILWAMLPGGGPTSTLLSSLVSTGHLRKGDTVIDGANTDYNVTLAINRLMASSSVSYLDVGFGGGPEAARKRAARLMVGGDRAAYEEVAWVFDSVAGLGNYGLVGGPGAGQAMKAVTNAMFYFLLPGVAETCLFMQELADKNGGELAVDMKEALRLASKIPHITYEAMEAGSEAFMYSIREEGAAPRLQLKLRAPEGQAGELPGAVSDPKVSEQVTRLLSDAEALGIRLPVFRAVFDRYDQLTPGEKQLYAAIKRRITGH